MGVFELILIAISLAMDAFAVSLGKGLTVCNVRPRYALSAGLWFGGFQALMPIIGYFLGHSFAGVVTSVDHWIAFALLILIGGNMLREAIWGDDEQQDGDFAPRKMFVMAVATSIDALAVGITMAFLDVNIWIAATVIGVITFVLSAAGVVLGCRFGNYLGSKAGILGGIILICLGIKILLEHSGIIG
ncbi:MAG: manganese efflux pump [Alistipes sp.]|nr:manganese efflux pump [Alistipes sp.]